MRARLLPRARLSETFGDLANLIAGALIVGQFVGQPLSWRRAIAGVAAWLALIGWSLLLVGRTMDSVFLLIYGIVFVSGIIVLLDWIGRRKGSADEGAQGPLRD